MSPLPVTFALARHAGRVRIELATPPLEPGRTTWAEFAGACWLLDCEVQTTAPGIETWTVRATVESGSAPDITAGLRWTDANWNPANYVLIPGAVYAGNRFSALRRPYPPHIRDLGQNGRRLHLDIGDVPRLSADLGRSHLDQTSAVPGMGLYCPARSQGWLWLTPQASAHGPYGLEVIENDARTSAEILLLTPGFVHPLPDDDDAEPGIGKLSAVHLHPENARPVSLRAGESIHLVFEMHHFECRDAAGLFARLFHHRTNLFPEAGRPAPDVLPFSAAWDLISAKHNADNWHEERGLYRIGLPWLPGQFTQFWQNGWVGGGATAYAMAQAGDATAQARAKRNLDFILKSGLSKRGLFKAIMGDDGAWKGDGCEGWDEPWCLVRRQGDTLFFVLRQLELLHERGEAIPAAWSTAAQRAATALCEVWEQEGEFGFQLNYDTGRLMIRGSTSGALIPGALVLAAQHFREPRYLGVARAAAAHYRDHDLAWGVTTGGPGDAVQAPDGESIFGLIESFILLHEHTRETGWLESARQACHQAASWAISYPYQFPPGSALGTLGIDARGALLANAQNKCGVPGICTLSGQGILRTFRASGDVPLLDLLRDIAHALPQYVSRADRPIPARLPWAHPLPHLPAGWMCERVNTTPSWPEALGEQSAYSCWCEVALMLTWCDLPGVYPQPDTGLLCALDHVQAAWTDDSRRRLRLVNPTTFPAHVRVLVETADLARTRSLPPNFAASLPQVAVPPGGDIEYALP
ncbi:MAG: hypothetical protein J0M19_15665 [Sphingomonadales bacterium]|nr:hypothetical protein [Sphingomonadales bacterium]